MSKQNIPQDDPWMDDFGSDMNWNDTPETDSGDKKNNWERTGTRVNLGNYRNLLILVVLAVILAVCLLVTFVHSWTEPTCAEPSVCRICRKQGEGTLPHRLSGGNCAQGAVCLDCGYIQAPQEDHTWVEQGAGEMKCAVCGVTAPSQEEPEYVQDTAPAEEYRPVVSLPLTDCYQISNTNKDGSSTDVAEGNWKDTRGNSYTDAICFWTIDANGWNDTESAVYRLDGAYESLELTMATEQRNEKNSAAQVLIYGDGELLYNSRWISDGDVFFDIVDITGVRELTISVTTDSASSCYCLVQAVVVDAE